MTSLKTIGHGGDTAPSQVNSAAQFLQIRFIAAAEHAANHIAVQNQLAEKEKAREARQERDDRLQELISQEEAELQDLQRCGQLGPRWRPTVWGVEHRARGAPRCPAAAARGRRQRVGQAGWVGPGRLWPLWLKLAPSLLV